MDLKKTDLEKQRLERNADLVRRMKLGESLALIPTDQTFFPPRPSLKKDLKAINRLYTPTDE